MTDQDYWGPIKVIEILSSSDDEEEMDVIPAPEIIKIAGLGNGNSVTSGDTINLATLKVTKTTILGPIKDERPDPCPPPPCVISSPPYQNLTAGPSTHKNSDRGCKTDSPTTHTPTTPIRKSVPDWVKTAQLLSSTISIENIDTAGKWALLEDMFAEKRNPLPTDIWELAERTGLSRSQITGWFNNERKKVVNMGMEIKDGHVGPLMFKKEHIMGSSDGRNVSSIELDYDKVRFVPPVNIRRILKYVWEPKALTLFKIISGETPDERKLGILKESRRLTDRYRADPFSEDQKLEMNSWKEEFIDKKILASADRDTNALRITTHLVEEFVLPWIGPYIYSKVTTQGVMRLSLKVALDDFSRHFECGNLHTWSTPDIICPEET